MASTLGLVALLVVLVAVGAGVLWLTRANQRAAAALATRRGDEVAAVVAPPLGGRYHAEDTEQLVTLPFVAFRDWGAAGRTLADVVTFTGPFGFAAHSFTYAWNEYNRSLGGADRPPMTLNGYHPPDRTFGDGVLIGLPTPLAPVTISSLPPRGAPGLAGNAVRHAPPPIAPGTPPDVAFAQRFRVDGDPATAAWLLTPAVIDGLLRAPDGVHVETNGSWLLALCLAASVGGVGPQGQLALATWARWFATVLPFDAPDPTTPAAPAPG